jgi:hypothetical protein
LKYALLAGIAVFATLSASCGDDDDAGSATPTGSIDASNVCGLNPDPATGDQLQVTAPLPSDEISSPMLVTGMIAVFEAQFNIAIKDAGGNDIATAPGRSSEGQTLAPFSESVPFTVTERTPACVWVFDFSERDGEPSMVHQIPVYLLP